MLIINLVDCADVGMIQCRGCLGFAFKTAECLRISGDIIRKKLQRNEPAKLQILSLVDNTHPPAAKFFDDAVMRNCFADKWLVFRHARRES